jgi:hypothetical protein
VKIGTNFIKQEIPAFENAGFQLPQHVIMSPRRFFGGEEALLNLLSHPTLAFLDDHPNMRLDKNIRRYKKAPSTEHANNCIFVPTLEGSLQQITLILRPGFGCIITLDLGTLPKIQQYMITIGSFPNCSSSYFKEMETKALGKRGQWTSCKHLYFVFIVICSLDSEVDTFIHASSFSFNEVKRILESEILTPYIP